MAKDLVSKQVDKIIKGLKQASLNIVNSGFDDDGNVTATAWVEKRSDINKVEKVMNSLGGFHLDINPGEDSGWEITCSFEKDTEESMKESKINEAISLKLDPIQTTVVAGLLRWALEQPQVKGESGSGIVDWYNDGSRVQTALQAAEIEGKGVTVDGPDVAIVIGIIDWAKNQPEIQAQSEIFDLVGRTEEILQSTRKVKPVEAPEQPSPVAPEAPTPKEEVSIHEPPKEAPGEEIDRSELGESKLKKDIEMFSAAGKGKVIPAGHEVSIRTVEDKIMLQAQDGVTFSVMILGDQKTEYLDEAKDPYMPAMGDTCVKCGKSPTKFTKGEGQDFCSMECMEAPDDTKYPTYKLTVSNKRNEAVDVMENDRSIAKNVSRKMAESIIVERVKEYVKESEISIDFGDKDIHITSVEGATNVASIEKEGEPLEEPIVSVVGNTPSETPEEAGEEHEAGETPEEEAKEHEMGESKVEEDGDALTLEDVLNIEVTYEGDVTTVGDLLKKVQGTGRGFGGRGSCGGTRKFDGKGPRLGVESKEPEVGKDSDEDIISKLLEKNKITEELEWFIVAKKKMKDGYRGIAGGPFDSEKEAKEEFTQIKDQNAYMVVSSPKQASKEEASEAQVKERNLTAFVREFEDEELNAATPEELQKMLAAMDRQIFHCPKDDQEMAAVKSKIDAARGDAQAMTILFAQIDLYNLKKRIEQALQSKGASESKVNEDEAEVAYNLTNTPEEYEKVILAMGFGSVQAFQDKTGSSFEDVKGQEWTLEGDQVFVKESKEPEVGKDSDEEIMKKLSESYEAAAQKAGLDPETTKTFQEFMLKRWGTSHEGHGYDSEWAERFAKGTEWDRADLEGQRILKAIDPKKYNAKEVAESAGDTINSQMEKTFKTGKDRTGGESVIEHYGF